MALRRQAGRGHRRARRASARTSAQQLTSTSALRSSASTCGRPRCELDGVHRARPVRRGVDRPRRRRRSAAGSTRCSTSPGCRRASVIRCWWSPINFLGTRQFTEAVVPRDAARVGDRQRVVAGGVGISRERRRDGRTARDRDDRRGRRVVRASNPEALADGGYRLAKEAIILYGMAQAVARWAPGASGSTAPHPGSPRPRSSTSCAPPTARSILDAIPHPAGPGVRGRTNRPRCWSS